MRTLFAVALLLLSVATGCSTPSKADLDAEVKRLCAIDGGVRVYEAVKLPPEKFNQRGQVAFYRPGQGEDALGPDYIFKSDEQYILGGRSTPEEIAMRRIHSQVMRRADGKLLGEAVMYNRTGGDMPGPWMPSSYYCPDPREASSTVLVGRIFW
jgi:hypothetical protein